MPIHLPTSHHRNILHNSMTFLYKKNDGRFLTCCWLVARGWSQDFNVLDESFAHELEISDNSLQVHHYSLPLDLHLAMRLSHLCTQ